MTREATPFSIWPRLLDTRAAALYCSVGEQTVRDWVVDGILQPVRMPGTTLRDKAGKVVVHASRRPIAKILIDRGELDRLIDQRKGAA